MKTEKDARTSSQDEDKKGNPLRSGAEKQNTANQLTPSRMDQEKKSSVQPVESQSQQSTGMIGKKQETEKKDELSTSQKEEQKNKETMNIAGTTSQSSAEEEMGGADQAGEGHLNRTPQQKQQPDKASRVGKTGLETGK